MIKNKWARRAVYLSMATALALFGISLFLFAALTNAVLGVPAAWESIGMGDLRSIFVDAWRGDE